MKSLVSIAILSITLSSCGFKPIYSSKNSNFDITNFNDNLVFWNNPKDVTSIYLNKDLNKIINIDTLEKKQTLDSFIRFYVK